MPKKPATKIVRLPAKASAETRAHQLQPALVPDLERKHTINDIARLANVSKKTVSRVINESPFVREETRARITEIIKRVGFTPDPQARALAFRRSFLIGLIYDNPNAPYVINFQEGALGALRRPASSARLRRDRAGRWLHRRARRSDSRAAGRGQRYP